MKIKQFEIIWYNNIDCKYIKCTIYQYINISNIQYIKYTIYQYINNIDWDYIILYFNVFIYVNVL